jgi:hypothetical protein
MQPRLKSNRDLDRLSVMVNKGLLVFDKGKAFGSGDLLNYGINSNTSANSFLKCMFSHPERALSPVSFLIQVTIPLTKAKIEFSTPQKTRTSKLEGLASKSS